MVSTLNFGDSAEAAASSADPEQLYAREKKLLEERRVLPLVALPEYIGLSQNVRDWMPARWGEWHLADVWLDLPEPSPRSPAIRTPPQLLPHSQPPRPPEPNHEFRTKLLFVVLLTIFASVSVVAYAVTHYTQAAFEAMDAERTEALVAQFKKEFVQRGEEIAHQAKKIAEANLTERMAIDLSRRNADQSLYVRDAVGTAQEHGLDYVEFVNYDGVLISSAQFPARVGYKDDWVTSVKDWNDTPAFLKKEELPDGVSLSLSVVRTKQHRGGQEFVYHRWTPAG